MSNKNNKKKQGRPSTKPVEKRKAYYVLVKVFNSMNNTTNNVLISRDTIGEIKILLRQSRQNKEFLGYWNGKKYEKIDIRKV